MSTPRLRRLDPSEIAPENQPPVDLDTLSQASRIVDRVRNDGIDAIREYAEQFGERRGDEPLVLARREMRAALDRLDAEDRAALERAGERIERFARAQRASLSLIHI